MINTKKIGVFIPLYNKESYIADTVQSVVNSFLPSNVFLEVLLVDDCSTDKSMEIVDELISKNSKKNVTIKILSTEHNAGPSAALNVALDVFDGDFVCPMDADDFYTPNSIYSRFSAFQQNEDIEWVTGNELTMTPDGKIIVGVEYLKELDWSNSDEYLNLTLLGKNFIPAQSSMVKLSTLFKVNFRWIDELKSTQDVWFNLKLLASGVNPFKIDDYVAIYRVPDDGKNSLAARSKKNGQFYQDFLKIAQLLQDQLNQFQYDLLLKIANNYK